ncbi:MAG TPA: glycosyltransferase family 4 protein, partial [Acetobacteraceae bacterium]|nr:glycosyltransferase family 4 protein [Acetobacteraceae bacterium]
VCADGRLLDLVRAEGFRVITVPMQRRVAPLAHLHALRHLVAVMRAERPDLVHAHMPISGFLARIAARIAGVPRVAYTCHGFLFNYQTAWLHRAAGLLMECVAAPLTDVYLTVAESEAADARRLHFSRTAVAVGNGRDPARFRPDPEARARLRAAFGTPAERPVVIAVSRLVRLKGYPELAAAMQAVPEAELWVVGERLDSDRGDDMATLLANAGLGDRLRLLGYRDDVASLLAAADIFVLPSHFEGLPMSVIEAMLVGLPVIASELPGTREQVVPELTGLLVPPRQSAPLAAALERLVGDPALRARMGDAGRARGLERFDEAKVIARTLDLLGL